MSPSSTSASEAEPQRKLSELGWKPLDPERRVHRLLAHAIRQLAERVDVLGRAGRRDQGRAETMRLGDDERDRNTLDGDTNDATLIPFDDGDDGGKPLERCELRPRILGSAHNCQVERELAEAARVSSRIAAQCVRDRPGEGAGTVQREPAARPWRKREGGSDLRLGAAADSRHRSQTAVLRRLMQLLCRLDAERAADVEHSFRRQAEKPPEPDQLGSQLCAKVTELRDLTRLDQLPEPGLDARADAAELAHASGAHQLRDRRRSGAHELGCASICARGVRARVRELEQRRVGLELVGDRRIRRAVGHDEIFPESPRFGQ